MADVKFMDISENSNPATTDSILIANKENGVKRTTLGKVGDMFAIKNMLHLETITSDLPTDGNQSKISAPSVDGYKFVTWIGSWSEGFAVGTYINDLNNDNSNIFITNINFRTDPSYNWITDWNKLKLKAIALYIKADLA